MKRLFFPVILVTVLFLGFYFFSSGVENPPDSKVYTFSFQNQSGAEFLYHVCKTETITHRTPPSAVMHQNIFTSVFDVTHATQIESLAIANHSSTIYHLNGTYYVCCTISPEISIILEYENGVLTRQEALQILQSIFINPSIVES